MKKIVAIGALTLALGSLTGCTPSKINFEGKRMSVDKAEDILESRIAKENLQDYDVDITLDTDKHKKKKKRK